MRCARALVIVSCGSIENWPHVGGRMLMAASHSPGITGSCVSPIGAGLVCQSL